MMLETLLKDRDVAVPVSRRTRYADWRSENGGLLDNVTSRVRFVIYELSNAFASLGSKIENAANVEEAGQLLERYLDLP